VRIRSAASIAAVVSMALAGPAAAQTAPTLFTHEAMIATKRLGAIVPSPDGRQAVIQIQPTATTGQGPTATCGSSTRLRPCGAPAGQVARYWTTNCTDDVPLTVSNV
jgi:hypothetical protein